MLTSLLTLALLTPSADAAFGGKIKNIRIRERNNSNGYRVVVIVKDDDATTIDDDYSVGVSFEPVGDAPDLSDLDLTTPQRQRATFVVEDLQIAKTDDDGTTPLSIVINDDEKLTLTIAGTGDLDDNGVDDQLDWSDTFRNDTEKVRYRYREEGALEVQLLSDDSAWSAAEITSVGVSLTDGYWTDSDGSSVTEQAGSLDQTRGSLIATFSKDTDLTGAAYTVTTTVYDAGGEAINTRSEQLTIEGEGIDDGIVRSTFKTRRKGGQRIATITIDDNEQPVNGLSTEIVDADGNVLLSTFDEAPVSRVREFTFADQAFDGDPDGVSYDFTLSFYDAEGSVLNTMDGTYTPGKDFISNLPVLRNDGNGGLVVNDTISASEGDILAGSFNIGVSGDDIDTIDAIEMQFNEPFEGPSPQENPMTLSFSAEWNKWVDTFDAGELGDEEVTITQMLFDADGEVIEEIEFTGPTGTTFRNGKGTRTAASSSSATADLL